MENGDTGNPDPDWVGVAVTHGGGTGGVDTNYNFFDQNPDPGDSPPCEFFPPPLYDIISGKIVIRDYWGQPGTKSAPWLPGYWPPARRN